MDIKNYSYYKEFLRDIINEKINDKPDLSIRWFSNSLNWPISLINDVFANRRTLTTSRLIELGSFLKLNSTDMEYLILLGLKDDNKKEIKDHFENELEIRSNEFRKKSIEIPNVLLKINYQAVLMAVTYLKDDSDITKIKNLLYTLPDLSENQIKVIIEKLHQENIISKINGKIIFCNESYLNSYKDMSDGASDFMSQYAENTQSFITSKRRQGPGQIDFKLITLPLSKINEVKNRYDQLFNWLDTIKVNLDDTNYLEHNIFQAGVILFPIGDKGALQSSTTNEEPK